VPFTGTRRFTAEVVLCRYVSHLALTCAYKTFKNYLQGVRIVHRELNLANPLDNRFNLERCLRGIRRIKGDTGTRKFAVSPGILARFFPFFDFSQSAELAIYAAMPLRCWLPSSGSSGKAMSRLTIDSSQVAENVTFFRRADIQVAPDNSVAWVIVRQTKTIQYTLVNKFCNGRLCNLHALQTSLHWFQNSNKSKTPNERF
jgi:hypothetical protein